MLFISRDECQPLLAFTKSNCFVLTGNMEGQTPYSGVCYTEWDGISIATKFVEKTMPPHPIPSILGLNYNP
jgi:hypothetical protein